MRLNRPVGIQPLTGLRHSAWSEVVVSGEVEPPTFRFSGVGVRQVCCRFLRVFCTVADRCCERLAVTVAVTVAASRTTGHVGRPSPLVAATTAAKRGRAGRATPAPCPDQTASPYRSRDIRGAATGEAGSWASTCARCMRRTARRSTDGYRTGLPLEHHPRRIHDRHCRRTSAVARRRVQGQLCALVARCEPRAQVPSSFSACRLPVPPHDGSLGSPRLSHAVRVRRWANDQETYLVRGR